MTATAIWAAVRAWRLWAALGGLWRECLDRAGGWLVLALFALCGVQTVRIDGLHISLPLIWWRVPIVSVEGWRPRALTAEATIAEITAAQKSAATAQATENHRPAAISAALAKGIDHGSAEFDAAVTAAARRYAAAHPAGQCVVGLSAGIGRAGGGAGGLRSPGAVGGHGAADLRGADHAAPRGGGADLSAELVAVPAADVTGCTANTADLIKLRAWAAGMIAAGVAKVED
ncbi:hypothetical protein GTZ99_12535 [Novosphingobium sp. FSY-8]|uniref:Uncharacterized protein n=1 Tax=Novosphingobium ovatum TaxID=1908523 RepID=A0ABW9XFQ3_9SPHN|nr:hypothetical protein [Novosphingobium ovatum]NBC37378.1 hypothetical protein [Novosphingobium ovatum]